MCSLMKGAPSEEEDKDEVSRQTEYDDHRHLEQNERA